MEDPGMANILQVQERLLWPQEEPLLRELGAGPGARVLDVGCGTGLISARLASLGAEVLGVDLFPGHIAAAEARFPPAEWPQLRFLHSDASDTGLPEASFDLVVCRCVLQAVPDPLPVLREMQRVCKPTGWLYILAEDYGLIFGSSGGAQDFYLRHAVPAARQADSDLLSGRRIPAELAALGCGELRVEPIVVDTLRCAREDLASLFAVWGQVYAPFVARHGGGSVEAMAARFRAQEDACREPHSYVAWWSLAVIARP